MTAAGRQVEGVITETGEGGSGDPADGGRTGHLRARPRPLTITAHHLEGEPVSPAEALRRPFGPFAVGDAWGPRWGTTWFRLRGRVPAEWAGEEVVLRLGATRAGGDVPGGEFLVFSTARTSPGGHAPAGAAPPGGVATALVGLSWQHAAASLIRCAAGGEEIDLHVEAAANPTTPEDRMIGYDWPELRPDPGGAPGFVLSRCELAVRRPTVRALALDLRLAIGLAAHHPAGSTEADEAHVALAAAVAAIEPDDVPGSAAAACAALAPLLAPEEGAERRAAAGSAPAGAARRETAAGGGAAPAAPTVRPRVTAVGHAHIDTAWLWPMRETNRKCARTFATALAADGRVPRLPLRVLRGPARYVWMEEHYPELFARIAERVAHRPVRAGGRHVGRGRLQPGRRAKSLVRQIVLRPAVLRRPSSASTAGRLWLPDVFGYSAALPADPGRGRHRLVRVRRRCRGTRPTPSRTTRSGGRGSTAPASSPTSRPPTPTTAT